MNTVHKENGNEHVHIELLENSSDNNEEKTIVKLQDFATVHLLSKTVYTSKNIILSKEFYLRITNNLTSNYSEIDTPPPKS